MIQSPLHHILRVYLPPDSIEPRLDEVLEYCRRTGCSEVLLFTSSYDRAPSFAPLEEISRYVEQLRPAMQRLRDAGITPLLNVLQTLGHVSFPHDQRFPFQRRLYADGRVSTEGACPLCPNLRRWVIDSYKLYGSLQPLILFVDDDFRSVMQGISCFCPLHLERFAQAAGRQVTLQEMATAVCRQSSYPPPHLRQIYFDVTSQGFGELAAEIRKAVHEISPNTRIGLMTYRFPAGAFGMDIDRIARKFAGPHSPLLRPHIPLYSEGHLRDIPAAFSNPDRLRAVLPDDIERWPEIEKLSLHRLRQVRPMHLRPARHTGIHGVQSPRGEPVRQPRRAVLRSPGTG